MKNLTITIILLLLKAAIITYSSNPSNPYKYDMSKLDWKEAIEKNRLDDFIQSISKDDEALQMWGHFYLQAKLDKPEILIRIINFTERGILSYLVSFERESLYYEMNYISQQFSAVFVKKPTLLISERFSISVQNSLKT